MSTPGFRIRLHNALVTPMMLMGVPRRFAIVNGTVCAAFVLGLHAFYMLPVCVVLHVIAMLLAKRDPYFFEVLLRHIKKKKFYRV